MTENATPQRPTPPEKKGLGPVVWVSIGCGGLLAVAATAVLLVGIFVTNKAKVVAQEFESNPAMAAAEMIVRLDPELELERKDSEAQTLTVRNTKTGEVVTVNVNEIRDGRISFETDEGPSSIQVDPQGGGATVSTPKGSTTPGGDDGLLPWVPRYAGAVYRQTHKSRIPQGIITIYNVQSNDSVDDVLGFYRRHYEELGWEVQRIDVEGAESTLFAVAKDKAVKMNISLADLGAAGSTGRLRTNEALP